MYLVSERVGSLLRLCTVAVVPTLPDAVRLWMTASFWYFVPCAWGRIPCGRGTFPALTIDFLATADVPRVARSEFS